jgi:aminopeptidase N
MSVVEGGGIIGGGMEYPMMTLIGEYTTAGPDALYNVTAHEIAHMWVPMIVATDERRYSWMDEGTTNFNENQARQNLTPEATAELGDRDSYLNVAVAMREGEIMRRSDYHYPGPAYVVATYYKPSTLLTTLRGLLGEETFLRAYREYLDRWKYRHPYPWDMWNTFEQVSERELDWFWKSWYYGTGVLDQAVASVTAGSLGSEIVVESLGENPMPTRLTIQLEDGSTLEREIPVDVWLGGVARQTLTVPGAVTRVEIDAANEFPDANRENNLWAK